ncbi:MAG: tetratricopeptide repeat protein [Planctomycetales bacterium]|nr:tetratricopeptide repeat protein [Planctomycetales bacterium]
MSAPDDVGGEVRNRAADALERAVALLRMRRPVEAVREAAQAVGEDGGEPAARRTLAWALLAAGRPKEGLVEAREAVRLSPDDPRSLQILGRALLASGEAREACLALDQARQRDPEDGDYLVDLSRALSAVPDWPRAEQAARAAVQRVPEEEGAFRALGVALLGLGRPEEAESALATARSLDPEEPLVHYSLGLVAAHRRRWPEALERFREALVRDPPDTDTQRHFIGALKANSRLWRISPRALDLPRRAYDFATGDRQGRVTKRFMAGVLALLVARGLGRLASLAPIWLAVPLAVVSLVSLFLVLHAWLLDPLLEWWIVRRVTAGHRGGTAS